MYNRYGHSYYGRSGAGFFRAAASGRPITTRRRGVGFISPGEAVYNAESETDPQVYGRYAPNALYPPDENDMQEIVVSGTKIPWWVWGIAGVAAFAVVGKFEKR